MNKNSSNNSPSMIYSSKSSKDLPVKRSNKYSIEIENYDKKRYSKSKEGKSNYIHLTYIDDSSNLLIRDMFHYLVDKTDLKYDWILKIIYSSENYLIWAIDNIEGNDKCTQEGFDKYLEILKEKSKYYMQEVSTLKTFWMYLYLIKKTDKLIVDTQTYSYKYKPVYVTNYRNIFDANISYFKFNANIIVFDDLKNDSFYEILKEYTIYLCRTKT